MKKNFTGLISVLFLVLIFSAVVHSQTTEFTYQGSLRDGASPANGNYDFEFVLYDALSGGTQLGSPVAINGVAVASGIFSVKLDFGDQFPGGNRFLEIHVRPAGGGAVTLLAPRQQINSAPYSVKAVNAANAMQLGGVAAGQYVLTGDARLSDARDPLPGSINYIQNQNAAQATSNFNISGNGTVGGTLSGNTVNTATQFNINGVRFAANSGEGSNTIVGVDSGPNVTGFRNSMFGMGAGQVLGGGNFNAFFGTFAGTTQSTGDGNTFLGDSAGHFHQTGGSNTFAGREAGANNVFGVENSFFGTDAGNTSGNGNQNTAVGAGSGRTGMVNSFNSYFGAFSGGVDSQLVANSTAVGARAFVTQGNSLVLGSINGINGATASTNVGIGTTAPSESLHVVGNGLFTGDLTAMKVGIGTTAPAFKLHVVDASNQGLRVQTNTAGGTVASFASNGAFQIDSNGVNGGRLTVLENGNVGIGMPEGGNVNNKLDVVGTVGVWTLTSGGTVALCWHTGGFNLSTCGSSLRYKKNQRPFTSGLNLLTKLKPITFDWKEGGMHDLGLGAEDVEKIEPLLVTYNAKGEIEGVKYDRIGVVLVNAVNEQQAQIESLENRNGSQQMQIEQQRKQIESLTKIVCAINSNADICRQ